MVCRSENFFPTNLVGHLAWILPLLKRQSGLTQGLLSDRRMAMFMPSDPLVVSQELIDG